MNSQLSLLVQLQQIDIKIQELVDQRRKIPEQINGAKVPLDQANKQLEDMKIANDSLAAERRSNEQDLIAHESQTQKLRQRLNELKTNKEYQVHLVEIDLANKTKEALEEKVLLAMDRGEMNQKELGELQRLAEEMTATFIKEKVSLEKRSNELDSELGQLEKHKEGVLALLEKPVYNRYVNLKASLNAIVVAKIYEGTCQGCQLHIPPQLIADVKRADKLLTCPYCFRILYWEDTCKDSPEFSTAQESSD